MAVNNETLQVLYSVVDANQEYNTKITLLFVLLFYSITLFIFSYWIERRDSSWDETSKNFLTSRVLLKRAYRWIGGSYIFIFPLMFLLSYRGAALETLLQLVYAIYIPFFGAFAIFGIMYFYDVVMDFTGVKRKTRK